MDFPRTQMISKVRDEIALNIDMHLKRILAPSVYAQSRVIDSRIFDNIIFNIRISASELEHD